ncbi:MAG: 16S rRNA (uracil(1498)-N(3))-methyltransferase [Nevskiaceae bacterium]
MTEHRVYVDMDLAEGAIVALGDEAYHHLVVVLRRIRGDAITLFNGRGGEYPAAIETVAKRKLTVHIGALRDVNRESALPVTLVQAVSKGERMDYTIQKAVELGVAALQPVLTDHVVVRLDAERWARKQEHWQSVAVAACEQSGRTRVPKVAPVQNLLDWMPACPPEALRLVLSPDKSDRGQAPAATPAPLKRGAGQPVVLLVGPEGGLSEVELKLVDLAGFAGLALGPRVLRTETAGVVALAVLQSKWGDLSC